MKIHLLVILPLLWIATAAGQSAPCWYDSLRLKNFGSKPKLKQDEDLFYYRLNKWREKNVINLDTKPMYVPCSTCLTVNPSGFRAKYIIPVVVHIVHRPSDNSPGDSSNIVNEQVEDQIANLNRYFAGYDNTDPRSVNTGIQFCLAQTGPGNKGIYRISSNLSNHNPNNMKQLMDLKSNVLPYKDYLHIYVVNEIVTGSGTSSGIQGYATFPGPDPQGIVIRYRHFGNANTCTNPDCQVDANIYGKVLVHEVGHFLGLQHPFEGGCVGLTSLTCAKEGDKCCDVPPVAVANSGCSSTTLNSCTTDVPDLDDMIENYMDYTNDLCRSVFTMNQAEIMHYTLQTVRSWLVDPRHINNVPLSCQSFSARFSGINSVMCTRDTVRLTAIKYSNMNPVYYWEIKNGNTIIHLDSTTYNNYSWLPPNGYGKYKVILRVRVGANTIADSIADFVQLINCGSPIKSNQGTWYFGEYAGLKFMQNAVIPENSAYRGNPDPTLNTGEGCISMCDSNGNLLFYGGGLGWGPDCRIFNQNHVTVSIKDTGGYADLFGSGSSTQGILSFPNPVNKSQYLIFTNEADISKGRLYVTTFDTSEGSYGKLLKVNFTKGIKSFSNFTRSTFITNINIRNDTSCEVYEQITAIPQCNGNDHWLITLSDSSDDDGQFPRIKFITSYDVKSATNIIPTHKFKLLSKGTQGPIKVSPDANFIAYNKYILKFDASSGQFSFYDSITLPGNSDAVYGLSFSSNSKVLYYIEQAGGYDENIWQLDLSIKNPFNNRRMVAKAPAGYFSAMQLGPDNKIYISISGNPYISVISKPNLINYSGNPNACDFHEVGVYTQIGGMGGLSDVGLPNVVDARKPWEIDKDILAIQYHCDSVNFSTNVCCASSFEWDFGDGSTHEYTRLTKHKYYANGTYTVTLKANGTTIKTHVIKVGISKVGINGLTVVCDTSNAVSYSAKDTLNPYYQYYWKSNNADVTQISGMPNIAVVKWHGNGKLKLEINDLKTGCKSNDSIYVRARTNFTNNIITVHPVQTPCEIDIDSISGSKPTGTGPGFKYGWIIQKNGANPYLVPGENKRYIIPPVGASATYRRIVYDSGCYYESNVVNIINVKNEIGGITGKCGGVISGTNMSLFGAVDYSWWESNDSFATDSGIITGANNYFSSFSYTPSPKWVRRVVIQSACTTRSNIIRIDKDVVYAKDLPEKKYICGNGNLADEIIFEFRTGLEDIVNGESNQLYKIPKGTRTVIAINNHIHANNFNDEDTVFCVQTAPDCGTFTSRKCVIKKSYNYIHFTTHPASETKAAGTNKLFFAALDSMKGVKWNWQVSSDNANWYNIIGSPDNNSFTLTNLSRCQNAKYYRVQANTGCGTTNSNGALLTVTGIVSSLQDYWMKDHWRDSGIERNPDSSYIVESADLWVRNKPDGIKPYNLKANQMIAEGENYIYYTVRNRGIDTAKNGKLYLYWTWAGTGEEWSRKWKYGSNNMYTSPNTGFKHPMGSEINKIAINLPNINPGDSTAPNYVKWDYNVPKPTWFIKDDDTTDNIWPTANICLLARIQTCEEPEFGMTYKENKSLHYNVIGNNNIVTRNCWLRFLNKPRNLDYVKPIKEDIETHDAGTTVISSVHDTITKYKVCINIVNTDYLSKANLYIEMDTQFKNNWILGGGFSNGFSWVQDNIFKVTSSNACIDSVIFEPELIGTIRTYISYKDPNDRFESGKIFPISISQYQYYDYAKVGEIMIEIADNPMPEPIIKSELNINACNWQPATIPTAKYIHNDILPYSILNLTDSSLISHQPSEEYYLEPATYLITSTDTISNTVYQTVLKIESANISLITNIDTLWYNCDFPDSIDFVKSCVNGVMYDRYDQIVSESSSGHYTLNPQEPYYTFICTDSANCTKYSTQLIFKDIIEVPASTSNFLNGMYNRNQNPCCFIDLTD
ncbi:MAG: hypothetical protein RIR55_1388, partial [Bacteroidota bacterium]